MATSSAGALSTSLWLLALCSAPQAVARGVVIPDIPPQAPRPVTVADSVGVRSIDSLSLAPDGTRFAIFVRQADPAANTYRTGWFIGRVGSSELVPVGDGGEVKPRVMPTGHMPGTIGGQRARWSPDGQWIAYLRSDAGQVQLWRSHVTGEPTEQLTRHAADVRDFVWSDDGRSLLFQAGTTREELRRQALQRARQGLRYDEDLWQFSDFMGPQLIRPPEQDLALWSAAVATGRIKPATEDARAQFDRAQARELSAAPDGRVGLSRAHASPAAAWLADLDPVAGTRRAVMSKSGAADDVTHCPVAACEGTLARIWWSADDARIHVWRREGINDAAHGFYAWDPQQGTVTLIARVDEVLSLCEPVADDGLLCVRESALLPPQLALLDLRSGRLSVAVDINPEFRNIRLGRVERIEWETPRLAWNEPGGALEGLYPERAYGYLYYPPGFDPDRRYPLFIDPYVASGFAPLGAEHPLHAYAASGMLVLRASIPRHATRTRNGTTVGMKQLYAAELDYPHLTMLMNSTLRALDITAARGFVDQRRVGIGGVSHGTFVPLYLMQKQDRIAAISISSPSWGPFQYYGTTQGARRKLAQFVSADSIDWAPRPDGAGRDFWRRIDIADHIDAIEAPILMQLAAHETFGLLRLIKHLADADRPYDAFVFAEETHIKWQPAHLAAIAQRNLDWFRFWLQGLEDAGPAKREQYEKWKMLRIRQCENPRNLNPDACG